MATAYPEYVTDGHHIYLWHDEYEGMFQQGKLKACDPPKPVEQPKLTADEEARLEAMRKKALEDAELAVKAFSKPKPAAPVQTKMEEIFGSPPGE